MFLQKGIHKLYVLGDSEILNARFSMAKSVGIIYAYVCGDLLICLGTSTTLSKANSEDGMPFFDLRNLAAVQF